MPDIEGPDIEGLYREHRARLVRLVERELHDRDDTEDVVQTAFLDAQCALRRGTVPHNPHAWLAAIALNAARRLRRRHLNVEALEECAAQEASRLPEIKAALAGLPKNEQAVVLYREVLGLSYAEMAERMGTTVPTVTMLLHRARSQLRGVLGIAVAAGGLWRWLRSNAWQATAAKASSVVVLTGGLATAGVVTGEHVIHATARTAASTATAATQPRRESAGIKTNVGVVRRHANRAERSSSTGRVHREQSRTATAGASTSAAAAPTTLQAPSQRPVLSKAPTALPTLTLPTLTLLTTAATVTTLVTAATGAVPALTATLPTPVTTVTVSLP